MENKALRNSNSELEDRLSALEAVDSSCVPHEVAVAILRGKVPSVPSKSIKK